MKWSNLSMPQALVLCALALSVVGAIVFAPEHLLSKLYSTSPATLAFAITTIGSALVGVFVQARKGDSTPLTPLPPRRWEDDNDDPTSPAGPRAMRRQSTPPNDSLAPARRNHPESK